MRRTASLALFLFAAACGNRTDELPGVYTPPPDAAGTLPGADGSAAAGPDATPGSIPPTPVSGALPCAVAQVLAAKCQACHRKPPVFGAPMPLQSYADTQARAPTGQLAVWQSMKSK